MLNLWTRKLHRWGAIACLIPMSVVVVTGILLQLKKDVAWIQPPTQRGTVQSPEIDFTTILQAARSVPEAEVESWEDVDRLDVRPSRGVVKVRCVNRWEVQLDLADGSVLSSTYRRSDLIERIHDGSWFHEAAKLWIFLPNGVVLLGLLITGAWLWYLPVRARRRKRRRVKKRRGTSRPNEFDNPRGG